MDKKAAFYFAGSVHILFMQIHANKDLKNSIYEGVFAHMYATLTGGVFLTGFALYLGMDEFMIGLLASMPFLATIFQLPVSHLIEERGRRKEFWCIGAAVARLAWIPILIIGLAPARIIPYKLSLLLVLILISYSFNSISSVSWLSLMSDLVPTEIRGRFFGNRNMLCGAAGMAAMLAFGKGLDYLEEHFDWGLPLGLGLTFAAAVVFGVISLRFLTRVSEPLDGRPVTNRSFRKDVILPFREPNFRRFLGFAFLWSFSVHFAAPFFTLYFLRDLNFTYGFVAALGTISGLADLMGMHLWGRISDRVGNKAIIRFASGFAICIPLIWVFIGPDNRIAPLTLNMMAGGVWAGINLCMNNLLLRISPSQNRSLYLSTHNIGAGLGAATGPIIAGWLLRVISNMSFSVFTWELLPIHIIFLASTALRLLSFQLFKRVYEPEEAEIGQVVRILRNVRGLNIATGFNFLLHPFLEIVKNNRKS